MGLNKKQRDFVDHYITHWNATKAAIDAGYSEKSARSIASENLTKPNIRAAIEAEITQILPKGEVVQRLAARSRSTLADVIRVHELAPVPGATDAEERDDDSDGEPPQAQRTLQGDHMWTLDLIKAQETGGIHQIKKLKQGKYGAEIEMFDALPAWELAGRFLKFLDTGGNILKYLDLTKLSQAQLQQLADGDDPIAVLLATRADPGESGTGTA